ncbi:terminal deoxycytidyl transferase [Mycolicibacterium rhodesiae JS60]|nr:terminal deoxycytidyl transferase [Mycolicibacterium rhodesiae JS60]
MFETRHRQPTDHPALSTADASEAHDAATAGDGAGVLRQLQVACDDLYCAPLDREAQEQVRELLLRSTPSLRELRARARRIKVACDELHDDPTDLDAQFTLLSLLDTPA